MNDEKLHQLLNTATVVPASPNLAERIIHEARISNSPKKEPAIDVVKENFMQQLLQSFIFPKPAYALACSLLVGLLIGFQYPASNTDSISIAVSTDAEFSSLFLAEVSFDE